MAEKRAAILLPDDQLADVDALGGPQGRIEFLTEVIRDEVNRRRLLKILRDPEPILKPEDYPEFEHGSEAWVRRLREEDSRLERERLGDWIAGTCPDA